jgi:DNA-binding MarR family transcriptional regulator
MKEQNKQNISTALLANKVNILTKSMSLFTRRTIMEWLPNIAEKIGINEERFMVMYELQLQPDISLKELAKNMGVSPSSMSIMVNSMVEQNIIERIADENDRRYVVLKLSEFGQQKFKMIDQQLESLFENFFVHLSEIDKHKMEEVVVKIIDIIQEIMRNESK